MSSGELGEGTRQQGNGLLRAVRLPLLQNPGIQRLVNYGNNGIRDLQTNPPAQHFHSGHEQLQSSVSHFIPGPDGPDQTQNQHGPHQNMQQTTKTMRLLTAPRQSLLANPFPRSNQHSRPHARHTRGPYSYNTRDSTVQNDSQEHHPPHQTIQHHIHQNIEQSRFTQMEHSIGLPNNTRPHNLQSEEHGIGPLVPMKSIITSANQDSSAGAIARGTAGYPGLHGYSGIPYPNWNPRTTNDSQQETVHENPEPHFHRDIEEGAGVDRREAHTRLEDIDEAQLDRIRNTNPVDLGLAPIPQPIPPLRAYVEEGSDEDGCDEGGGGGNDADGNFDDILDDIQLPEQRPPAPDPDDPPNNPARQVCEPTHDFREIRGDISLGDLSSITWTQLVLMHRISKEAESEIRQYHGLTTNPDAPLDPSELRTALKILERVTGLKARVHGRCPNNCLAYDDRDEITMECEKCGEPRYEYDGNTPRATYVTLPLEHVLKGWWSDTYTAKILFEYRQEAQKDREKKIISDFWNAMLYQELKKKNLFEDPTDMGKCIPTFYPVLILCELYMATCVED